MLILRLFVLLSDYSVLGNAANKHSVVHLNNLLFKVRHIDVIVINSRHLLK